mmetsp:Transcript_36987/g.54155  ORF Transcript_36987/g.54155 Transcript_36987/m.54155 type:complete len:194 (-) Transcript_36987:372-953(-)
MRTTKGQSGNKNTHKETSFCIISSRHKSQNQSKHDNHLCLPLLFLWHLLHDSGINKFGKDKDSNVSTNNEKSERGNNGSDNLSHSGISLQCGKLTENNKSNHVIDDGGGHDELSYGRVYDFSLAEYVHGNAETGGSKGGTGGYGGFGVEAEGKGDGERYGDGCDGSDDCNDDSAGTDETEGGEVNVYPCLQHQ